MTHYVHSLTEIEQACGVTLDDVARELPRVALRDNAVWVDGKLPPALATSTARAALAKPAAYSHHALNGTIAVYKPA
ncbi:hypothetical protein SEA_ENGINEER_182 [Gordonia Phage Engineer]|nr:hypothetical protein SEA_ENGINEER_182 [Gordonia Phage Engineer]